MLLEEAITLNYSDSKAADSNNFSVPVPYLVLLYTKKLCFITFLTYKSDMRILIQYIYTYSMLTNFSEIQYICIF
jgi:hypothetical protein